MALTKEQIEFCVKFWAAKLKSSGVVTPEQVQKFAKQLRKVVLRDADILTGVSMDVVPERVLSEALKLATILEDAMPESRTTVYMPPDGSVRIWHEGEWYNPEDGE